MFRYTLQTTCAIFRARVCQCCVVKLVENAYDQFVVRLCACALSNLINFLTRNDITFSILPPFLRQFANAEWGWISVLNSLNQSWSISALWIKKGVYTYLYYVIERLQTHNLHRYSAESFKCILCLKLFVSLCIQLFKKNYPLFYNRLQRVWPL